MSSSDPTSNFDSLNVSSEPIDIPAAVGEASSQRSNRSASSTHRRAHSKSLQGQGQGRHDMSPGYQEPKVHDSGRHPAVVSTGRGFGSDSQPSQLPSDFPSCGPPDFYSQHLRIS